MSDQVVRDRTVTDLLVTSLSVPGAVAPVGTVDPAAAVAIVDLAATADQALTVGPAVGPAVDLVVDPARRTRLAPPT